MEREGFIVYSIRDIIDTTVMEFNIHLEKDIT